MRKELAMLTGLVLLPAVSAAIDWSPDIGQTFSDTFRILYDAFQDTYVQFGIMTIFLIILFYNIFCAGISRIKAFGGSGGYGGKANKYGKMVALSLSIIGTAGILFFSPNGPIDAMERIFTAMGILGAIAMTAVIFGITYYNFKGSKKTWPVSLISAGLALMFYGMIVDKDGWFGTGLLLLIIGIILFLLMGNEAVASKAMDRWDDFRDWRKRRGGDDEEPDPGGRGRPGRVRHVWARLIGGGSQ